MPDSLLLYSTLVFTRRDNMKVTLMGRKKNEWHREVGIYTGQVTQDAINSGTVALDLTKGSNDSLRVNYIGDATYKHTNIGIGSILMYTVVLTARLNGAGYILIQLPVKSALGWYFKFGFYPDPIMAHKHDGDSNNERAMHDCELFGDTNLVPSEQSKDSYFNKRFASTICPVFLKGNIDLIEINSQKSMHKRGWSLSARPETGCWCTLL